MKRIYTLCFSLFLLGQHVFAQAPIMGTGSVCAGATTQLTDATTGGTWSSNIPSVASIGTSGIVTGNVPGTATISYIITGGSVTMVVTVNANPVVISGATTVCIGSVKILSDATSGGAWASSNALAGTIDASGNYNGLAIGTSTITYQLGTGCYAKHNMTTNPLPSAVGGTLTVCAGAVTTLTDATTGSAGWTSSNTTVATAINSGAVTGVAAGTANVTYSVTTGCTAFATVTVNPLPAGISNNSAVCAGVSFMLTDATTDGTWSSSNSSVATIGSGTGTVIGVAGGSTTIKYILSTGCYVTAIATVNPILPISGNVNVCAGLTSSLSDAAAGGTWSSDNTGVATIGTSSGLVTGISTGSASIVYTLATSCSSATTVNVNPLSSITGTGYVCAGQTSSLADATTGGTWSSNLPSVASIGSATGIVTGNVAGTATISYKLSTGCTSTTVVTVNPNPTNILGASTVCINAISILSDAATGGTWSSSNTSAGTVDASGNYNGLAMGTSTVTYQFGTGCYITRNITTNALPLSINGTMVVCAGSVTSLTDATTGSIGWTSSTTTVATVVNSGTVTGVAQGTTTITYTISSGCAIVAIVTVGPVPPAISNNAAVCAGGTITLTDALTGGTWSSNNTATATIGSGTGIVTTIAGGNAVISYTISNGCSITAMATVNPVLSISGITNDCVGQTTSLSDALTGGTWSSGNTGIATIGSSSGLVAGVSAGSASIVYTLPTSCTSSTTVNIIPLSSITGSSFLCFGATSALADATTGGTWSSNVPSVASIGSLTGIVTGNVPGTATVSYILGTGCTTTTIITVNANPAGIAGPISVCIGSIIVLSDATTGGTWSSSNTSAGTIDVLGNYDGLATGASTVTYQLGTGCYNTRTITSNPVPLSVNGTLAVCAGSVTTLTDATTGSAGWTSSNTAAATAINSGAVTGVAQGTSTITYLVTTGCYATAVVTVNSLPSAISNNSAVCAGSTITLTDAVTGGVWGSSNSGIATVGTGSGIVTGIVGGNVNINYSFSGCAASVTVTVDPILAINGNLSVCTGYTTMLTDASTGGTWSSSNPSLGSIGSSSGIVSGLSSGSTSVTYTVPSGCFRTVTVTIGTEPAAISGTASICIGTTTSLSDAVTGGTWSSNAPSIASIGTSGIVTGNVTGAATISYSTGGSCTVLEIVTVLPAPASISGGTSLCQGATMTLSDASTGGTWSSSNLPAGTIGSSSGILYGAGAGSTTVTYQFITGCYSTRNIITNTLPAAIGGTLSVCLGSETTLNDATTGSIGWASDNTTIATVLNSGVVTGQSAGSVTITYTVNTGCSATAMVTVDALLPSISNNSPVCAGSGITLTDATTGGSWVSDNTGIATIGSSSGVVTGVAGGTATISYAVSGSCTVGAIVTINPLSPISGITSACIGTTTDLSDASTGGTWSSSNPSIGSIGSSTGIVSALTAGSTVVTYTLPSSCIRTTSVSILLAPSAILGTASVCSSGTTTLSDAITGGTWASDFPSIASVGTSSGIVTGNVPGTATASYTTGSGCTVSAIVTVQPDPATITGASSVCQGLTITLSDALTGGAWASSTPAAGTVDGSGNVNGIAAGSTTITYQLGTGCYSTKNITVNTPPTGIGGTLEVCIGAVTTLTDATTGSIGWTSGNTTIATVINSGAVTGQSAGSAAITYTINTGCYATTMVTIDALPPAISGNAAVCSGSTLNLTDATTGGTWVSGNTSYATIGSSSGIVTAMSGGAATVTYSIAAGCSITAVVTVNPIFPVSGTLSVCIGSTTTLSDISTGGTWSSSNPSLGSIGSSSGIVTGLASGSTTVTYSIPAGCTRTASVTINESPASVSGTAYVCLGYTTTLTDAVTGGTWSSNVPSVASVVAATGVVTGNVPGTATVSYLLGAGCTVTTIVTVNNTPAVITGGASVCINATELLSDITGGGAWSSSNASIGTIDGSGNITGITVGSTIVTYQLSGSGCYNARNITVTGLPSSINGTASTCIGSVTMLSDATTGAVGWTSSTTTVATVINSGAVTGIAMGTATITYEIASGCIITTVVTVNTLPAAIQGNAAICQGAMLTLTDATTGGTWSSHNTAIATVGSASGTITGIAGGTTLISYFGDAGCYVTAAATINPVAGINGTTGACVGSTTSLSDAAGGGTWSSGNTAIATVGTSSGLVTGVGAGSVSIVYMLASGCTSTTTVNINPMSPVLGAVTVCGNATITLSDATTGGTWSSNQPSIASIGVASGIVTGSVPGHATISYKTGSGCAATMVVTVNAFPASITGSTVVCDNATETLGNTTGGGTWSSSNTTTGTIDPSSGIIAGLAVGTTTITYQITATGCFNTRIYTVDPLPAALSGTAYVCAGSVTMLSDATSGAAGWSSSAPGVASVINSGAVTGVTGGTATITYEINTGCTITVVVTVNSTDPGTINGPSTISLSGGTITLSDIVTGGVWKSTKTTVAIIASDGTVTPVASSGTTIISYTVTGSQGCIAAATTTLTATAAPPHHGGGGSHGTIFTGAGIVDITAYMQGMGNGNTATDDDENAGVLPAAINVLPNPNKGTFIIKGTLGVLQDEEISLEVTDIIGQVIYKKNVAVQNGNINEQVQLGGNIATGMYILNVRSGTENKVFHIVIEQ